MNSNNTKKIIISCAVIVIITCLCVSLIMISGLVISLLWPINFEKVGESLFLPEMHPQTSGDIAEGPGELDTDGTQMTESSETLPEAVIASMREIEEQVVQLRGLTLMDEVPKILLSPEALKEMVVNEFFAEYTDEDARQDVLVLSLLGLIPEDFELKTLYHDLYSEQIAGFYDSETKEIYIVSSISFVGHEKMTYAHEFTHVLQDQTYDLDAGLGINEEACDADSERCAAIQALIEGDAMLSEYMWFENHASRKDQMDVLQMIGDYSSQIFDNAPPYFQLDLLFPYEQGFAFAEHLFEQGDFAAIDAAYLEPPLSTEQIIHPERYPNDVPQLVNLPDLKSVLSDDWILLNENVMGEWSTYLILSQSYEVENRLSEDIASKASEGWGGDAYAIYLNELTDELIFVFDSVWDTALDADEFMNAMTEYANLRWDTALQQIDGQPTWSGSEGSIVLFKEGERILWVIAPNNALAETVFETLK